MEGRPAWPPNRNAASALWSIPMSIIFRIPNALLATVRSDLHRRHQFAAERIGFLLCRAGGLSDNGVIVLAASYDPVADEDYLNDRRVGAMMGPAAIRKAMQRAYNGGKQDIGIFHVHIHNHVGLPAFSATDLRENKKFVPDFFNVAPFMPHGAIVLSRDKAVGFCWRSQRAQPLYIDQFTVVGAPLRMWGTP
jgi:hypothetical protein